MGTRLALLAFLLGLASATARAQDCSSALSALGVDRSRSDEGRPDAHWSTACVLAGEVAVAAAVSDEGYGARVRVVAMRGGSVVGRTELPLSLLEPDSRSSTPSETRPIAMASEGDGVLVRLRLARPARTLSWRLGVEHGLTWIASWVGAEAPVTATPRALPLLPEWPAAREWPNDLFLAPELLYAGEELEAARAAASAFRALLVHYGYLDESETYDARHWQARDRAVVRARARAEAAHGSRISRRALLAAQRDARRYGEALETARALCASDPGLDDLRALAQLEDWLGNEAEAEAARQRITERAHAAARE